MFWPFTKWPLAPAPYDQRASTFPIPATAASSPFPLIAGATREAAGRWARVGGTDQSPTVIWLPNKPGTAKNGPALTAAQVLLREQQRITDVANRALNKLARGVTPTTEEAKALEQVQLPADSTPARPATGIYSVPRNPAALTPPGATMRSLLLRVISPGGAIGRGRAQAQIDHERAVYARLLPAIGGQMMRAR